MTTVRIAATTDLPALTRLNLGLFTEDAGARDPFARIEWPGREAYFEEFIADGKRNVVWVADDAGQAVGYLAARLQDGTDIRPVTTAVLESLYVQADQRNAGFGAVLVERFLEWAREVGAGRALVSAYSSNTAAIRFYERFGLRPRSTTLDMPLGSSSSTQSPSLT